MKAVTIFFVLLTVGSPALSRTFHVWTNSPSNGPGTDWATAFHEIQSAIDVATNAGDVIRVTNGVYSAGGAVTPGSIAAPLLMCRIVVTNAITIESVNGPDDTVIMGQWPPGNSAIRCAFLTNNAILSGFTLSKGCTRTSGDTRADRSGGGAYASGATLTNCIVSMCSSYAYGGGIYGGTIVDSTISGCYTLWGGGGVAYGSAQDSEIVYNDCDDCGAGAYESTLVGCIISNNTAQDDGGGAYLCNATNCVFKGNEAIDRGGGTYNGTACNCLFINNHAGFEAGGTYRGDNYNCTIVGNSADLQCGGASDGGNVGCIWYNCIIYYNSASNIPNGVGEFEYSCSTILLGGDGSFTNPPLFVDTNGWADLRLMSDSPCRNTGTNQDWMASNTDLDGAPRIVNGRADMGCYESIFSATDYDGDGMNNEDEAIAGTDPTLCTSYFLISEIRINDDNDSVIEWQGVSNRVYGVRCTTNMSVAFADVPGATNLPGADAVMNYTNTSPGRTEFYRIRVSRP